MNNKLNDFILLCQKTGINLTTDLFESYMSFGYNDKKLFVTNLNFLLDIYNIHLVDTITFRSQQNKFRNDIIKRDKCCVISGIGSSECEAAHIIPVNVETNYDINNGLLLSANLHKSFDLGLWLINPNTLTVEINYDKVKNEKLSCIHYEGHKLNIVPNSKILGYIKQRYILEKNNESKTNHI